MTKAEVFNKAFSNINNTPFLTQRHKAASPFFFVSRLVGGCLVPYYDALCFALPNFMSTSR